MTKQSFVRRGASLLLLFVFTMLPVDTVDLLTRLALLIVPVEKVETAS